MVALVLRDGVAFDATSFAAWLDAQADLSPKWQPRFVRVCEALPSTPTNKVLTRTLAHEKFRSDRLHGDAVDLRARGAEPFRLFGPEDESSLRDAFTFHGQRGGMGPVAGRAPSVCTSSTANRFLGQNVEFERAPKRGLLKPIRRAASRRAEEGP